MMGSPPSPSLRIYDLEGERVKILYHSLSAVCVCTVCYIHYISNLTVPVLGPKSGYRTYKKYSIKGLNFINI